MHIYLQTCSLPCNLHMRMHQVHEPHSAVAAACSSSSSSSNSATAAVGPFFFFSNSETSAVGHDATADSTKCRPYFWNLMLSTYLWMVMLSTYHVATRCHAMACKNPEGRLRELQELDVSHKVSKAWKIWHENRAQFYFKNVTSHEKYTLWKSTILQAALWGSEGWALTDQTMKKLNYVQFSMVSKIMGLKRCENEPWISWEQRRLREARAWLNISNAREMAAQALSRIFRYAGHMARYQQSCNLRMVKQVALWRNREWWFGRTGTAQATACIPWKRCTLGRSHSGSLRKGAARA